MLCNLDNELEQIMMHRHTASNNKRAPSGAPSDGTPMMQFPAKRSRIDEENISPFERSRTKTAGGLRMSQLNFASPKPESKRKRQTRTRARSTLCAPALVVRPQLAPLDIGTVAAPSRDDGGISLLISAASPAEGYSTPRCFLNRLTCVSAAPKPTPKLAGRYIHDQRGIPTSYAKSCPNQQNFCGQYDAPQHQKEMSDIMEKMLSMVEFAATSGVEDIGVQYRTRKFYDAFSVFQTQ